MKSNQSGIIFDLDGTLWDVSDRTFQSVNVVTNKYNLKPVDKETVCKVFGLNKEESAKMYFPYLRIDRAVALADEICELNNRNLARYGGNVFDGLEETLKN